VKVFKVLISRKLRAVSEKMNHLMFDAMLFSFNWFICLFTDKLDEHVML